MRLRLALLLALFPAVAVAEPSTALSTAQAASSTEQQIDAWLADAGDPPAAPATASDAAPAVPRAIHGEADVTFGSNGYRGAHVAAAIPVGEDSTLGVAVGDDHVHLRHGSVDQRSLSLSLQVGSGTPSEPCGLRRTGVKLASDLRQDQLCGRQPDEAAPFSGPVGAELMGGR